MPVNLSRLKYLAFEINDECPLTSLHLECPRNSNRWQNSENDVPITLGDMISFYMYCSRRGFNGLVNVHYYNEPLATKQRLLNLVDALPEAKFSLWTNGVYLSPNSRRNSFLKKFTDVMVTIYPHSNLRALANLKLNYPHVRFQTANLDARRNDVNPQFNPHITRCNRPWWELIVDYYGNGHVCCGDWKGEIKIGNIKTDDYDVFIRSWEKVVTSLSKTWNAESFSSLPRICQVCTTRTPGMSQVRDEDTIYCKGFKNRTARRDVSVSGCEEAGA